MALTAEQQAARENRIGASFGPPLMANYRAEIDNEYQRLIGDPDWKPLITEDDWLPAWGAHGEPFIINWHERKTGHALTRRGESAQHPTLDYVGATLDCFREHDSTVLDCKVCSAWKSIDELLAFYTPQCIIQKVCSGARNAGLLLVHGNAEPVEYLIEADPDYETKVWQRLAEFWHCVQNFIPPIQWPPVVPPEQWITIDLDRDGAQYNWAGDMRDLLGVWSIHKPSADTFKTTVDDIKKIFPAECGKLFSGQMMISRNRAGAVSIKHR